MAIVADRSGVNPTDDPYCTHNRTVADNPNGAETAEYVGEIVYDSANDVRWIAKAAGNAHWVLYGPVLV